MIKLFSTAMLGAVALLSGCDDPDQRTATPPAAAASAPELKAEMLVHWTSDAGVACASADLLAEFIDHAGKGEQTKALAMLNGSGKIPPCRAMPITGTGKIVSTGKLANGMDVLEVVPAGSGYSDGLWTPASQVAPGIAP